MTREELRDYLLGRSLRKARAEAGLNQTQLGLQAGWEPKTAKGKVSKIESGGQIPTDADLEQWAAVTNTARPLLEQWKLLAADENAKRSATYKSRLKGGLAPIQQEWTEKARATTRFRFFEDFVIPRYLQVPEYARAVQLKFKPDATAEDLEKGVRERRASAELLYDTAKSFKLIIDEPVLFKKPFPRSVMRPQLLYLQSSVGDEDQFRIYPSLSRRTNHLTPSSFQLFDDMGYIETEAGGADPLLYDTVVQIEAKFQALWAESVGGDDAREIIARAITDLLPD